MAAAVGAARKGRMGRSSSRLSVGVNCDGAKDAITFLYFLLFPSLRRYLLPRQIRLPLLMINALD